ncbi:unnamed protein product [Rotaria sordida]|uniref:W2 domain-containing protein n=3 Tax=Rotaria sordida TaxID=392033 RepID=A0A819ULX6_9BILA|nr:unnamed protein product [Rotaria sordida]
MTTVSSHTFGDIHQAPLLFKNHNRPYHRMLALHCYSAFEEAKKKQKEFLLTDADFHYSTNYIQDLLNKSLGKDKHSHFYQWLMNNPVGEEMQLETSRTTSSAFITNDSLLNPAATEDDEIKRLVTQSPSSTAGQDVAVLHSASSSSTYLASLDMNLIELFRMINKQQTDSSTQEEKIFQYIRETMNPSDPKYIRNIILSYLHSCVIDSNPKSIIGFDQYNARDKAPIIQNILAADEEKQIEALYTTQQFVIELKHPHGMVLKLFDTFYDEECVKEEVFWNWLRRPNPAKKNDQIQLIESTKKFFIWLSQSTSSTIKDIDNDDDSSSDVDNDDDDDSSNVDKSNDVTVASNYNGKEQLEVTSVERRNEIITIKNDSDLPSLRNPEILIGQKDLTALSYLNEPEGRDGTGTGLGFGSTGLPTSLSILVSNNYKIIRLFFLLYRYSLQ